MSNGRRVMWNGTVRALPLAEQLRASAIAGCEALSVTPSDYVRWLGSGVSTRDVLAMADDAGVRITHLDPFVRWVDKWRPDLPGEDFPVESVSFDADDFFRFAEALQVESFTAWGGFAAGTYELGELIDSFGRLCERAAVEGLRCDLEFIAVFGIRDLRSAWQIVRGAGAANSGVVLDFWHYMRSGRDDNLLRTIPGSKVTSVQLCDAAADVPDGVSLVVDGLFHRRPIGDGDFPVGEILDVLRATDGLNNVGPEIFSSKFDMMTADEIGRESKRMLDAALGGAAS